MFGRKGPYKTITLSILSPLVATLIGLLILLLLFLNNSLTTIHGMVIASLTILILVTGGVVVFLSFLKERTSFSSRIITQNRDILFMSTDAEIKENLYYSTFLKNLIDDNLFYLTADKLRKYLRQKDLIPYSNKRFSKQLNSLPQVIVKVQKTKPMFNWGKIHKPVNGLAYGVHCTIALQGKDSATIALIKHELGHILLDFVFNIRGEQKHHDIMKACL